MIRAAAILLAGLLAGGPASACPRDAPPCEVAMGSYHVALPKGAGPHPAVIFLHGADGTGRGVLGMSGTVRDLTARGYAVIAPDGLPWGDRRGGIWTFRPNSPRPIQRDEAAFFAQVIADAAGRHGVDADRVILSGFSAGGFMTTYAACADPAAFAAFAPVSGGFWRPHPQGCAGPVRLFHTHGWRDGTVPLEGRVLRAGVAVQGDIFEGLALFRAANGCQGAAPTRYDATGEFLRRRWDCAPGSALELALFPGGHGVPGGWADMMLDWFEGLAPR